MTVDMIKTPTATSVFVLDHENEQHRAIRAGLNRASWTTAKGLSQAERETFRAVVRGERVYVTDVLAAIVSGLSANATRFGQSMARRAGRQPLLDLYALLPSTEVVSPVEAAHRERVEQSQARRIADLQNRHEADNRAFAAMAADLAAARKTIAALQIQQRAVRPQEADRAAQDFAFDLLTSEQRQRVADFRTGYRAAQG